MIASGIASKLSLSMSIPVEKSLPVTGHCQHDGYLALERLDPLAFVRRQARSLAPSHSA